MLVAEERLARLEEIAAQVRVCVQCRLSESRRVAVPGEGPLAPELLWLGEAPGEQEDAAGRPFVGAAGSFLRREMSRVGLDPDAVFLTNVVKCRPAGNRPPRRDEIAVCTSLYLARQIELLRPMGIVAMGATAGQALLADRVRMTEDHGTWRRDYNLTGQQVPVFVTYHPAAALRNERWRAELRSDLLHLAESMARVLQPPG
ncbi:MAG: uracil-DNA glycosylase [Anaerolineae bacterium]|nr:uracil-DNA glycosylase [Anaerolineae bacterium]